MLLSGANVTGAKVIIWSKCYHLELMLSSGAKWYHLRQNVIIWDEMLSFGASVIIWSFFCYLELLFLFG
jgi:hypothetical protein